MRGQAATGAAAQRRPEKAATLLHTAESPLAHPGAFVRRALTDLGRSPRLALEIAKRDIRGQYRQSLLGVGGVFLPMLAMVAGGVGFRHAGLLHVEGLAIPYALFVLFGVTLWMAFVEALNAPVYGMLAEQRLLARTACPVEAIVLGKLGLVVFNAAVRSLPLVVATMIWGAALSWTVVLAPIGLAGLIALGTAGGLLLAPLNLVYRDVSRMMIPLTTVWLFLSPVYFPPPDAGWYGTLMRLNPVSPLLAATRSLATDGLGLPVGFLGALGVTVVLAAVAWVFVRVTLPVATELANG